MSVVSCDEVDARSALDSAHAQFQRDLLDAGLLVPMGIDGLYGRGEMFEKVIEGIDHAVTTKAAEVHGGRPQVLRFPPIYARENFERTGYISSFPNLTGAITTFTGKDREHQALIADVEAGLPWDGHLNPAGTMLVSAVCHPSYSTLPKVLPESGHLMDVYGFCYRHEPSVDPARMQAFRMHEFVMVGTAEQAAAHRDAWVGHGLDVLLSLGLSAGPEAANDPFFGRTGRLLSANQREENLKTELVVRLYGELDSGTAVVSANCHREHFGETFELRTADGAVAHSACVGFGMERIALAMFRTHGLDARSWPSDTQTTLGW